MIVDTHTHFYDPTRPQGIPWPGPDNDLLYRKVLPQDWRDVAGPENVTHTVVVEASAWLEDNQWILDLAENDPSILGLVGHIDANRPEFSDELARFADHPLFVGIRCGGGYFENIDQGSFLADAESLVDNDLEMDVLTNKDHFAQVCQLAQRLPQLRIVINHVGSASIDGEAPDSQWHDQIRALAECPSIYMKISGFMESCVVKPAPADLDYYRPVLDALWDAFGADRVVYGSNWPVSDLGGDYAQGINIVKSYFAEKGAEASEKYLWKNSQKAYKWTER